MTKTREKMLLLLFFSVFLCALPATHAKAQETLRLGDLLGEAEAANPGLASLEYKYEAARERVPQAGALPEPMLGLGVVSVPIDTFAFNRDPMTGKMVELSQMFPFYGKRALKAAAAGEEAGALDAERRDKALMLRAEVKTVYYELYAIKKTVELIDKNAALLDAFKKAAEARYSVGTGNMKDIIKVQLETAMLTEKKIELGREERTKRAYLASLLGREAPVAGEVEDIAPTQIQEDKDALAADAIKARPMLKAADARIRKGSAMVEMARREYYPDFTVSANYMSRERLRDGMDQPDMVSLMVSVNLPVWWTSRQAPAVREAGYEKSMAEKEKDSAVKEIYYKVDSLLNQVAQDDRLLKLYKDVVIPQATEDIDVGLANYSVGKLEFISLLDSRRILLDYETGYYSTLAEREKAVAELEAATGKEFK
jgi:cobalt-zinc-cadmium efflux system outer membrane protein